jgi:DNA-directed RNA polymerase subunit M/transcription elongation factor TFIIS
LNIKILYKEKMTERSNAITILKTIISDEDAVNLESDIHSVHNEYTSYNTILYQVVGDLVDPNQTLESIRLNIKSRKVGWSHPSFKTMSDRIDEQNDFIENPFEVEEGVFQCKMCGSRRVFSYTRQDRSCDEGTSVYAQCVACKIQWRERG